MSYNETTGPQEDLSANESPGLRLDMAVSSGDGLVAP